MKKITVIGLSLILALAVLAGCNKDKAKTAAASTSVRTDLIIAIDSDITTMHPSDHATSNEMTLNSQIYDTLMYTEAGHLYPRLAENWEIGKDGMTYTFHLVKGVTFHNGSPFTAKDVKFSCELYQASAYQGAVVDGLDSVEIVDDHTVIMRTSTVFSPFLENIATMFIGCKNYFDTAGADKFASDPVGCGPYQFVSRDLGSKIVLKAFDNYYRGKPAIKDVTFRILSDDATVAMSMQAGEVDLVAIQEANFYNLRDKSGITIQEVPMSRFGFISLNHEKYPYSEVKFRQAVAYAIDRQNLIELALDGIGLVNSNLISPLRFGWSANQPEYNFNPDKSKQLLSELGIKTPYDLGVMPVAERYKTQAEVIQSDLANIGLTVRIEVLEFNALLGNLFNGNVGITTMQMSLEGVTQSYAMALTTPYVGMANNVRYSNKAIDDLFQKAVEAVDESERFAIYNQIFTRVQEEAVFVVLYNTIGLYAHNDKLNVPQLPLDGTYHIFDCKWQ